MDVEKRLWGDHPRRCTKASQGFAAVIVEKHPSSDRIDQALDEAIELGVGASKSIDLAK
jgi:hypothetical protein